MSASPTSASSNDSVVKGAGALVADAAGNVWAIDVQGQITVNGVVDSTTAQVDLLAYDNGVVWQKNAANQWYSKTAPSAAWVYWPATTPPVTIPDASANNAVIVAGGTSALIDANGNAWRLTETTTGKGYKVSVDSTIDQTTANVVQMAIVNGTLWQENTAGLWYSKTSPASAWSAATSIDPLTGITQPIELTWIGGGSNLASDPANWSPSVAPKAGDTLQMNAGTMNLSGNALAGDTLMVGDPGPSASATINVGSGTTTLNLHAVLDQSLNINITANSILRLNAEVQDLASLNVSGGTIAFIGSSGFNAFDQVLNANLIGTGSISLQGGNASGETMQINGSVGSGLAFTISAPGPCDAGLQIDQPSTFQGQITLDSGYVAFMGLQATSGELLDGVLKMFDGDKLVNATRVADGTYGALQMQQTNAGVMLSVGIGDDYQPGGIGTMLPLTSHG